MASTIRVSILHDVLLWRGKSNSARTFISPLTSLEVGPPLPTLLPSGTVISIDGVIHQILALGNNDEKEEKERATVAVAGIVATIIKKLTLTANITDKVGVALSVVGSGDTATSAAAHWWLETMQSQLPPTITVHLTQVSHLGGSKHKEDASPSSPKRKLLVCPGFMDSHVHFFDGGRRLNALSFGACKSRDAFISNIRRFLRERYIGVGDEGGEVSGLPLSEAEGALVLQHFGQHHQSSSSSTDTTTTTTTSASSKVGWLAGNDWSDVKLGGQPTAAWIDEALTIKVTLPSPKKNQQNYYVLPIPAVFYRIDCHSCVLNSEALRLCGIDQYGPVDPEGGTIVRENSGSKSNNNIAPVSDNGESRMMVRGNPTGMLREKAMALARLKRKEAMDFDDEALGEQYNAAASHLLKHGITSCFSMCSLEYDNLKEIEYLLRRPIPPPSSQQSITSISTRLSSELALKETPLLRIRSVVVPEEIPLLLKLRSDIEEKCKDDSSSSHRLSISTPCAFGSEFVSLGAVKVFADGALGSRTAAMEHPYGDLTGISSATSNPDDENDDKKETTTNKNSSSLAVVENASGRGARYDGKARSHHQCPCGLLLTSVPELYNSVQKCSDAGFQCCVHGIGDRAVLMIQDAFEAAAASISEKLENGGQKKSESPHIPRVLNRGELQSLQLRRNRIEHCQHVSSMQQLSRFARSHTIPSVQPCHLLFDGDHVEKRLGPHRARLSYPLVSMIEAATGSTAGSNDVVVNDRGEGEDSASHPPPALCFGTDWMVTSIDPIANIQAAMLRQPIRFRTDSSDVGGSLPVWAPEQRLSFEQCLAAYTTDAAYAAFWEDSIGRIEVGYKADFTILSLPDENGVDDDEKNMLNPFRKLFDHRWNNQEEPHHGDDSGDVIKAVENLRVEAAICDSRLFPTTN